MEVMVAISVHCWYSFSADNISENTPLLRCTTHTNLGQGGHSAQMQKTAEAITCNSKKKATLVDIPEDISDNPMVAPSKASCKVFIY